MAKRKQRNNGVRYSESDKMVARHIIAANGGTITDELLEQVRIALHIPTLSWDTLQRWTKPQVEKPSIQAASTESREHKVAVVESVEMDYHKAAAREIVEHTFRQYAKRANNLDSIEKTDAKDAAKVMESMLKLMQLLDGQPTAIVQSFSVLNDIAKELDDDAEAFTEAQRQFLQMIRDEKARKSSTKVEQTTSSEGDAQ